MGIIPFPYNLIAGAVASVALIGGTYGLWRHEVNKEVAVKIAAYVAKKTADDAALQAIEVKTNTKIQIQYVDRVKVIHDTGVSNVQVITKYVHDNEFLSNGWVSVHDAGSENGLADTTAAADGTSSGITAAQALETVVTNYATCNEWRQEVIAWQDWVQATNADIAAQNKRGK